jgi:Uma2 family endonuclease
VSALVQLSEVHRITIAKYHELVAGGWLDDGTRVELIDGMVVDMSPRSPQHEAALRWLINWLIASLDHERYELMITGSMTIGSSEPEPDVAILTKPAPTQEHPSRALLVIEVAVSSRDRDLRSKPVVYAGAVDEYWVVDLERQELVLHRDGAPGGYRQVERIARGRELAPVAVPLAPLNTEDLFATVLGERE